MMIIVLLEKGKPMAEYIERDKIFSIWRSMPATVSVKSLSAAIHQTPAIDIVHCKDYKIRQKGNWCYSLHTYNGEPVGVADDFFCAYGKRKSDG